MAFGMRAWPVVGGVGAICLALVACSSQSTNQAAATGGSGGATGGSAGAAGSGATGGGDADASAPDSGDDGCVPKTCDDVGAQCGEISDGCGTTLTCASCPLPSLCQGNQCCSPVFGTALAGVSATNGSLCNLSNGNTQDDQGVGLDYAGGGLAQVDGKSVSACVTFDFGSNAGKSFVVRARTVNKACGVACTDCGQGNNTSLLFGSADDKTYTYVAQNAFGTTFEEHTVTLSGPTRYVMVGRGSYAETYRDLEVDSVRTTDCP